MLTSEILDRLPYKNVFRFVDDIEYVNNEEIKGSYTFKQNEYFYTDHFKNNPITPGVMLTEVMAQIGLVCFGIYLVSKTAVSEQNIIPALFSTNLSFYKIVLPAQRVEVISRKIYFRHNKLKCNMQMFNGFGEIVCEGDLSGLIKPI